MSIILDGTTGITTPGLTNTGTETILNLTTTGNTILGDATTDTLNVGAGGLVKDASGNVGIGTSSPSYKLEVRSASDTEIGVVKTGVITTKIGAYTGGESRLTSDSGYWTMYAGGSERMRLDSSGNLGLGVTPSAWVSSRKALQVGGISALTGTSTDMVLSSNWYVNGSGSDIYLTTAAAALYQQTAGKHNWFTAPSGTAGNAITFTQAMTLSSAGNLLVGTTTDDGYKLKVVGGNATNFLVDNGGQQYTQLLLQRNGTGNTGGDILIDGSASTMNFRGLLAGAMTFQTSSSAGSPTEQMRISSAGNLLLGVTSDSGLTAGGDFALKNGASIRFRNAANSAYLSMINVDSSNGLNFGVGGVPAYITFGITGVGEVGLFDPQGYLQAHAGAGSLTGTNYHSFRTSTSSNTWVMWQRHETSTAGNAYGTRIEYRNAAPNNTGNEFLWCIDMNQVRAAIRSNGGLANYSANNVNLSDERTKTDIELAGNYLDKICAIPVKTFKYKDQTDDQLNLGVIAQDVEAVAPELVDVSGFGETPEDGVPLKAVYQTDLQYALMKAIQELKAEFDAYKAAHP